jgi:hypothetical protein
LARSTVVPPRLPITEVSTVVAVNSFMWSMTRVSGSRFPQKYQHT